MIIDITKKISDYQKAGELIRGYDNQAFEKDHSLIRNTLKVTMEYWSFPQFYILMPGNEQVLCYDMKDGEMHPNGLIPIKLFICNLIEWSF